MVSECSHGGASSFDESGSLITDVEALRWNLMIDVVSPKRCDQGWRIAHHGPALLYPRGVRAIRSITDSVQTPKLPHVTLHCDVTLRVSPTHVNYALLINLRSKSNQVGIHWLCLCCQTSQ
jgi:hypothetical protein